MSLTDPTRLLYELACRGGAARRNELAGVGDAAIRRAVADGLVLRVGRARYALPVCESGLRTAVALAGVRSHRTAALAYGWKVATPPRRPEILVPRGRRLTAASRAQADVRWRELAVSERRDGLTSPVRTVVDCLCDLPPEESLPVADSALASGRVSKQEILRACERGRGRHIRRARGLAALADGRAANPFESRLRLIASGVPGLTVVPQVRLAGSGWSARVDLADERLGIVAEADSFEWHGGRRALADDAERYDLLVVSGWLVLRFAFEQVFGRPAFVTHVLREAVALRSAGVAQPWRASLAQAADCWQDVG